MFDNKYDMKNIINDMVDSMSLNELRRVYKYIFFEMKLGD